MPAAQTGTSVPAYGIYLIYEYYAGGILLGLLEQIPHPGGADAYEHLHEVGTAYAEERHPGFSGNGLGQKRLTCSWRTHKQNALGYPGAQFQKSPGLFQKLHDLLQFRLFLILACHVVESDLLGLIGGHSGLALAERHHTLIAAALGLLHDKIPEYHEYGNHEYGRQHLHPPRGIRILGFNIFDLPVHYIGL